ncbi:uncharacterized protein N7482_000333 [Penicillium canariense]|uniref:AAA+ ATPase domain-containing protein n=1 Tax=Penicillium canariense TaxID=189055 RepID=A0A9W9LS22_9EURO|nr:uncharacterized protein N7482_000333 [Penicillium canariense]KAJ5174456.1 hypothetical protein N7482_000333 [Penicillium canariense]
MDPSTGVEPPTEKEPEHENDVDNGQEKEERQPIVRVDQMKKQRFRYVKSSKPKSRSQAFSRYVIIVARRISAQGVFTGEYVVDIRGKHLQQIISEAYQDMPSIPFSSLITLEKEELKLLFYERVTFARKLQNAQQTETSGSDPILRAMIFELTALVSFIDEHFSSVTYELSQLPTDRVTYDLLWTLFRPNTRVFGMGTLREERVFRLSTSGYKQSQDGSSSFILEMDYLDFNGHSMGWVEPTIYGIGSFHGSKPICQLPFFPIVYHENCARLERKLVQRGERLLGLHISGHLQEYKGHAIDGDEGHGNGRVQKFTVNGRVMLDPVTFDNTKPNNDLLPSISTPINTQSLAEDQMGLLSPILYGFSLTEKRWGGFDVMHLQNVEWNKRIDEMLVLPEDRKDFVKSLVKSQRLDSGSDSFDDFVRNKGKGLVGLLAGPPGVGKTLTAEVVAEITRRPLYMISSGELGQSTSALEKNLASALALAETWKAVLLLDEADVFLSERDNVNLTRNAITSIFLRDLEYYQGIILLTTNRMSSIDPAFQSRIHFCFEYDDLSELARRQIWSQFLSRSASHFVSEEEIIELSKLPMNGRQIKNAMKVSTTVAKERKVSLTKNIITQALTLSGSSWRKLPPADRALPTDSDLSDLVARVITDISKLDPSSASSGETRANSGSAVSPAHTLTKPQIGFLSCTVFLIIITAFQLWSLQDVPNLIFKIKLTLMLASVSAAVVIFPMVLGCLI